MKRIIIITGILLNTILLSAQFSVKNDGGYLHLKDKEYNLDGLILLNGITSTSTITYNGEEKIEWKYTIDGSEYNSTQESISPENGILYTVCSSKDTFYLYTIDYSLYKPELTSLDIIENDETKCVSIELQPIGNIPDLTYTDKKGKNRRLDRKFKLSYDNSAWKDSTWQDVSEAKEYSLQNGSTILVDPAPMKNTLFSLAGDQWAEEMGLNLPPVEAEYKAVAIKCHPKGTIIEREYKNEKDRTSGNEITGSGPLVVEFEPKVNPVDFVYYEWFVYEATEPNKYQRYNDTELRYTFEDTGEYMVKLTVTSDGGCEHTDSLRVKVLESMLEAPNVFTPNGDGMNDEWRVAYKSIERYNCIVQNRWGRTVFKSDDPGKGWDGTINGKPAAEGTYYYVIVAYGTDLYDEKHKKAGQQIKYKLSGDINLIR